MDRRIVVLVGWLSIGALGCRAGDSKRDEASTTPEGWSVTAWGERYEVFAETGPLVAGANATSNAHVTVLSGFAPLKEGAVSLVLRGSAGAEEVFRQERSKRDGIYPIEVKPSAEGTFDLVFRIESLAGPEDLAAGRVRIGSAASPGGRVAQGGSDAPEGVSFLKEQQWRTEFATAWVREGMLAESVEGPAQVKPSGGGEVVLTAGVDATVAPSPWPYTGLDLARGGTVFRLVPRVGDRSLPELHADASSLEGDVDVARRRVERLSDLEADRADGIERCGSRRRVRQSWRGPARRSRASKRGSPPPGVAWLRLPTPSIEEMVPRPSWSGLHGRAAWPRSRCLQVRPSLRAPRWGASSRCGRSGSLWRCVPRRRPASRAHHGASS